MSPEYAISGIISAKSDVFSFGVLVLEVLSGIKTRESTAQETPKDHYFYFHKISAEVLKGSLLSSIAGVELWQEDRFLELLDPIVMTSCPESELLRCIQVGLLCVQESPSDRPTVYAVVTMLTSENFLLPEPKRPGFLLFQCPTPSSISQCPQ
ncbi:unnamed protein product [Spirodela intermedia]|uniref:Serine-threonine/tyrosine-protein kinase catalytic domain-containing protein n=1 Tax=Spirodela intermedia TaxID=51605 RepID=A0ABN7EC46_SPIIN|nr:unnamed protein product [Spirodela intermedia]